VRVIFTFDVRWASLAVVMLGASSPLRGNLQGCHRLNLSLTVHAPHPKNNTAAAAAATARYFVLTFVGSIVWIGALSFIMCDFSIRAGCVLRIPGLLMGLVFIAAGTSVPDALSSVAVGRNGMGDSKRQRDKNSRHQ